ncbi:hypothetical protein ASPFODRAFT_42313 [Aspergillus luchuensis CBS 106.47]|uniref:Uncharacterized protein n=1 Tax=Aspergillus luchuensis (strain CBS 106.47) TaxID=1137211 RepID=A0A1M3TR07_ASPLC|nr:hypothetical protein ASPFODRAFT_42313 [Aspergillus luchuensis CBS 106.47]
MSKSKYQEVPEDDGSGGLLGCTETPHSSPDRLPVPRYLLYMPLGISLLFNLINLFYIIQGSGDICIPNPTYPPANQIIDYETVTFTSGSGSAKTPIYGPF